MDVSSSVKIARERKRRRKTYLLAPLALAVIGVMVVLCKSPPAVTVLNAGQGRRIIIYTERWFEATRPLYYQVRQGLRVIHRGCLFYHDWPSDDLKYKIVLADHQSLVGVLGVSEAWEDDTLLFIMHDFASGQSYPYGDWTDEERDKLFDRLQQENPDLSRPAVWDQDRENHD